MRQSLFMNKMRLLYRNDRLALRVILGRVDDGSYERAREDYKKHYGTEAIKAFDLVAQTVYRNLPI